MWTPKRIIMLSGCFLAFFVFYLSYAYTALGRMDGLPPLPEAYWPNTPLDLNPPGGNHGENQLTRKIKRAFGAKCKELNRPIRLDIASRNMVLCAEQFELKDGRVSLAEPSLAMFGKDKKDGLAVEINTLSGRTAMLTFDRPVHNFSEINNRKITEAEIVGNIEIRSNRRRAERDQDLYVGIRNGPLHYREATRLVWTEDNMRLEDHKSKPNPHVITGKGMTMELATEAVHDPKHPGRKPINESITGVKSILLHSGVVMDLYSEGKGGLLSSSTQAPTKKPAISKPPAGAKASAARPENAPPAERSHMHITNPGSFRYVINKDHDLAYFDIPTPEQGPIPNMPRQVDVIRTNLTTSMVDHLVCHHLVLRMHRKESKPAGKSAEKQAHTDEKTEGEGAEIEEIHATGPQGTVVLTSDAEKLDATCNDLFHHAVKGLTILKDPREVIVHKEDNDIHARELHIQEVKPPVVPGEPEPKPYQNIDARGPGHIRVVSKEQPPTDSSATRPDGPRTPKVQHAYWQDLLTFSKDGGLDLLVLNGKARFIDESAEQSMEADILKVWLDEAGPPQKGEIGKPHKATAAVKPSQVGKGDKDKSQNSEPGIAGGRKVRHIESVGNVRVRSREMNIHDTGRLVAWFKDVPAEMHMPPATSTPAQPGIQGGMSANDVGHRATTPPGNPSTMSRNGTGTTEKSTPRQPKPMPEGSAHSPSETGRTKAGSGGKSASGPNLPPADNRPPPRPFDLTARSVEAKILRSEIKSTIDELWCEGSVAVKQEPAKAEEQGTDVRGDTLKMTAKGQDLYYLVVTGDLGMLQTDKICIWGTEINIDQSTNKAWVYGEGIMKMESATNFQGDKLEKPVPMTVLWQQSMLFNGASAEFIGNVQGEQDKGRLACQRMHVFFDRTISLREGNKSDEPAKVRELVCDRDVRVEDSIYEGDILKTIRKLRGPGLQMIALEEDDGPAGIGSPVRPASPPQPGKTASAGKSGSGKQASEGKTSAGNEVHVSGPGDVTIIEHSDGDTLGPIAGGKPNTPTGTGQSRGSSTAANTTRPAGGKPHGAKPAGNHSDPNELKLTYVEFQKRMDANSKRNMVWFYGDVRVLNLPCRSFDMKVNLDAMLTTTLPEKAMYMRCDRLQVLDHPTDGQPNKQMEAHGRVYLQGKEFYGRADWATYNQQKEQVILYGGDGYALLYKQDVPGGKPSVLEAKKIIYNRATGETNAFEAREISGDSAPKGSAPANTTPKTTTPKTTTTPRTSPR
jgi:lipopolysaccharide export system protein LptA